MLSLIFEFRRCDGDTMGSLWKYLKIFIDVSVAGRHCRKKLCSRNKWCEVCEQFWKFSFRSCTWILSVCLLGSSVVVNVTTEIPPELGWVRKLEDVLEHRDPFFENGNEKRTTPTDNLSYVFHEASPFLWLHIRTSLNCTTNYWGKFKCETSWLLIWCSLMSVYG